MGLFVVVGINAITNVGLVIYIQYNVHDTYTLYVHIHLLKYFQSSGRE